MPKTDIIRTPHAPEPIGVYQQAVRAGPWLLTSGQIALDLQTHQLIVGSVAQEAECVLSHLTAILKAAGAQWLDVVKLTVYLTNMDDFTDVNQVLMRLPEAPYPARSLIGVQALPRGARVEIEAMAFLGTD